MRILRDAYFVAIALNHLAVDLLNSQKEILLVFVAPSLGLSNADIGLAADVYPLALVLQTNSILILITGTLLTAPLLSGFTDYTNQPYRMISFIVFFSVGIGLLFTNRKI